jgi:carbon storage regulator
MLVLTRKLNEKILIGDRIRLTVLSVRGGQVRIGIEAPEDVAIFREELSEMLRAAGVDPSTLRSSRRVENTEQGAPLAPPGAARVAVGVLLRARGADPGAPPGPQ